MEEYIRLEEEKARRYGKVYNWETAKYDFKNEFLAIVYDDALTSKSDFLTEPTLCPQHIDEFNLKNKTSLSEYDEVEQSILYFNDLFPFNIIYPNNLKSGKDNDDNEIDIIQSSNLYVPFGIPFDPKWYYKDGVYIRMLRRPSLDGDDDDDDYDKKSIISTNTDIFETPSSDAITTSPLVLPIEDLEVSLIMGNEDLNTIPEKESNEFIKSSVDDLVPILKKKAVTFSNPLFNLNDDFISSDDESLSDEDVLEDNVKIYSNPLFEFNDEYISSDIISLFDEVLEDIECKDSYDPNLNESTFLVTPLFDSNEDEYFTPGDDIELLLHHDPSIPKMSIASILEGFINKLPLKENDDLFDLESKNDD
uniref:Uncharacterized protein n=1 Tax=Tanacetum cinerariifolium TaxID=118510 RepID=A0A6L2L9K3_TANCI|nr:hypothetical protein [Tanacetum cinerariifolium]